MIVLLNDDHAVDHARVISLASTPVTHNGETVTGTFIQMEHGHKYVPLPVEEVAKVLGEAELYVMQQQAKTMGPRLSGPYGMSRGF